MKISEIMTRNVTCIRPTDTLRQVAEKLDELDVGGLPVCENDRLVGFVTDRDIVIRSVSAGQDPNSTQARNAMTAPVIYCFDDQDIADAMGVMKKHQIRRMVILNRDKRLSGILALGDLALHLKDANLSGKVLETLSEPSKSAAA